MAVNVDTVYRTVLLILNKEQRGYMTPDEFNKVSAQVQLEIFNEYFEDLNQKLRLPGNNSEYADRTNNIQEKISIFEELGTADYANPYFVLPNTTGSSIAATPITTVVLTQVYTITGIPLNVLDAGNAVVSFNGIVQPKSNWTIAGLNIILTDAPTSVFTINISVSPYSFYKLGSVVYNNTIDVQRVQPNELVSLNLSDLTKPSNRYPVYIYKDYKMYIYPTTIQSLITATYIRRPIAPSWGFTTGANNQYFYSASNSIDFELHPTEQTNIITKILLYSGIIIQNTDIIQITAQQLQAEQNNSKA